MHGGNAVEAYSAGSQPSGKINSGAIAAIAAIAAMRERGYDLGTYQSKSLDEIPPDPTTRLA